MHRITTIVAFWMFCLSAQALTKERDDFAKLDRCAQQLHRLSSASNIDYEIRFLADELFYIIDRRSPALYVFTPSYAGRSDFSPLSESTVRAELTRNAQQVEKQSFPFTPCCQTGLSMNIAIAYSPSNVFRRRGYFYVNMIDSNPGIYEPRHPYLHDARHLGIDRFLPGPLRPWPDFTSYRPEEAKNSVTVTQVTGQPNKGVEYHVLTGEERLWNKNARDNSSLDAKHILINHLRVGLAALPAIHAVGQRSDCWGHLGCDYTYSASDVAREQTRHDEALAACSSVINEPSGGVAPEGQFTVTSPRVQLVSDETVHLSVSKLRAIRASAEAGDPEAQFTLGNLYEEGEDIPQDDVQAVKWLRKSAEQDNARAQSNLGVMYDTGRGVKQDRDAAIRWYRKAADQGDSIARDLLEGSVDDACHEDAQCALVYSCGDAAINKIHLTQFDASACSLAAEHNPNLTPQCLNGQCRAMVSSCHGDAECAVVWGGCGDIAVNNENVVQQQPAVRSCLHPIAHNPQQIAHCQDNRCLLGR